MMSEQVRITNPDTGNTTTTRGRLRALPDEPEGREVPAPKTPKAAPLWEIGRPSWHKDTACFETGTMAFFPQDPEEERSGFMDATMRRRIQDICGNCPMLIACFKTSIENRDEYGYWAGIGPTTRFRILRDIKQGQITLPELVAALSFRGPVGLSDAYRK